MCASIKKYSNDTYTMNHGRLPHHTQVSTLLQTCPISRILFHILRCRSYGFIRRGKVALMERAYLVRLKRANDCVKHATIMEQDQVLFFPVMRIDQLAKKGKQEWYRGK
jgi:hypothetical protein